MARDFRTKQIRTTAIIGSGSIEPVSTPNLRLAFYPEEKASSGGAANFEGLRQNFDLTSGHVGDDVWCIFGSQATFPPGNLSAVTDDAGFPNPDGVTGPDRTAGSSVLFTGNVVISGSLYAERQIIEVNNNMSGDLYVPNAAYFGGGFGSSGVTIATTGTIKSDEGLEADYVRSHNNADLEIAGMGSRDVIFKKASTTIFTLDNSAESLLMALGKKIELGAPEEAIWGDGTDLTIASGGDIIIPGTTTKLEWGAAGSGEHIVNDGSNGLNLAAGAKISLTSLAATITSADLKLDVTEAGATAGKGLLLRDRGIHIGGTGTGIGIAANTANNSPIRIFKAAVDLYQAKGTGGSTSDVNYPFNGALGDGYNDNTGFRVATLGSLVISNRTALSSSPSGRGNGKIVFDGNVEIGTLEADNLTISGDLTVNGTTTTLNVDNLLVEDPVIIINKSAGSQNAQGGIAIEKGAVGAGNDLVFGRVDPDTWGAGKMDTSDGGAASLHTMTLTNVRAAQFEIGGSTNHISVASNDLTLTAAVDVIIDAVGGIEFDSDGGIFSFKDGGTSKLEIDVASLDGPVAIYNGTSGDDIVFLLDNGGEELMRIVDSGAGSLRMEGAHAIEFNDGNKAIYHDGTNLKIASNTDIKLSPTGTEVIIDNAAAKLNFSSALYSIRLDGNVLKFKDSQNTGGNERTLTQLATIGANSGGGIEYAGDSPAGKARSDYTFLLDYANTDTNYIDHGVGSDPIKDRATDNGDAATAFAGSDLSFYVNSQHGTRKIAGFAVDIVASGSMNFVDQHDAESNGIIYQSQDLTYFKSRVGNGAALTTHMYLKPGVAGVGGAYLGENNGLFFHAAATGDLAIFPGVHEVVPGAGTVPVMNAKGHVIPLTDNDYNLGSPARRFANLYTGDLHLRNDRGDWSILEEEDFLCVINNKTGKKYKMMLQPIEDEE